MISAKIFSAGASILVLRSMRNVSGLAAAKINTAAISTIAIMITTSICFFPKSSKPRSLPRVRNVSRDCQPAGAADHYLARVCVQHTTSFAQAFYLKMRVNSDMPQSLDIPARITINTNMKTETITTILSFTMLFSPGKFKAGPNHAG
ncbi:MAG TPA: hypothetical protein VMJ33_01375 [Gallionella sp.]|nr:hypothetical protein [Gallionella sp.]